MNRIHRIVFNRSTDTCQAVSETASSHGGATSSVGTSLAVPRLSRMAVAFLVAGLAMTGGSMSAWADGGAGGGGLGGSTGGAGGTTASADGSTGGTNGFYYTVYEYGFSGGGGGGGVQLSGPAAGAGGRGGNGGIDAGVGLGGAGGEVGSSTASSAISLAVTGGTGSAGTKTSAYKNTYDGYGGGGGGGGGFGVVSAVETLEINADVTGGSGGVGAETSTTILGAPNSSYIYGGAGGGGQGGGGVLVSGSQTQVTNTSRVSGGNGGLGGAAQYGSAGGGGAGGAAIVFTGSGGKLSNTGTISGGNGGTGGTSYNYGQNANGSGGVGVIGSDLTIINNGTISGGLSGDGNTRAHSVEFTGGANTLELREGWAFTGNVVANGTADTLVFGGTGTSSFDLSSLSNGFLSGFEALEKTGTSSWMLTGNMREEQPTPTIGVRDGNLQIGDGQIGTYLYAMQGVYTNTADNGGGTGTGVDGGKGQAVVNVTGGAIEAKANARLDGGHGASGSDSYADMTNGPAAIVGGAGGAGGAAVVLMQGSLSNEGYLKGGSGGRGGYVWLNNDQQDVISVLAEVPGTYALTGGAGGAGGNGVETSSSQAIINSGRVEGGRGGYGTSADVSDRVGTVTSVTGGAGGAGGNGIVTSSTEKLTNSGYVYGGSGNSGGSAELYSDGDAASQAVITGGAGGAGGNAVIFTAMGSLHNQGNLYGGSGGYGGGAYTRISGASTMTGGAGGEGAAGALFSLGGTALNSGDIYGGYGGSGGEANSSFSAAIHGGTGGAGGHGIAMLAAGSVTNTGSIQGGQGANGGAQTRSTYSESGYPTEVTAQGAIGSVGGDGVFFAANGTLSNSASGMIVGGEGGGSNVYAQSYTYDQGSSVAQVTINHAGSAAGGAGVYVGGVASVTNDGAIVGGIGGGNGSGGGGDFGRSSGGNGNNGNIYLPNRLQAMATVYGNTGGIGGAALALAGGGLATNNVGGKLQGGQGGTSAAYAQGQTYTASMLLTAIGSEGGQGGAGADVTGGSMLVNAGNVSGGQGGDGGYASARNYNYSSTGEPLSTAVLSATGGNGGTGGAGVTGSHGNVVNLATGGIAGGNGGIAGGAQTYSDDFSNGNQQNTDGTFGMVGAGGVGITGSDLKVTNAGKISGGFSGDETEILTFRAPEPAPAGPETRNRAAAIQFTGGVNSLTLESTSVIEGRGLAFSAADTLALGGASNSTFDVATIGPDAQFSGFGQFGKTGSSTWTLTGANTAVTPWTVSAGTLAIASEASLGAVGGALTLAGGTLQTTADISTARAVTLTAPGGTFKTDAATTLALSGAVTGSGGVTKDGAGTLRLTGANSFSGGTTITAGTLIAGVPSLGSGAIVNNATLVIDEGSNTTMANALSGRGSLTKTGAGQLLYTGNGAAYNGALLVAGGTFSANGTLGGTATIGSGATLKGRGTIGTTTLSGGATLAPGNSIGTLTVSGDFTFAPGSSYEVEANAAGQSDLLRVSGTATLGGASVVVIPENGSYAPLTTYTILTAGNRVGTFGSVSSNFAFLDPTLRYVANDVQLTLARNTVAFPAVGVTLNQKASAAALESLGSGTLFNAVVQLNAATAQSAFNQLSGEIHASAKTAMLEDSRFVREAGLDRVRQAQGGAASGMSVQDQGAGNSTWARVFGSKGHIDGDGNASRLNRDIGGFFVGADTTTASGWQAGGLFGYSQADLDTDGLSSKAKTDSYHVGVYGGNQWDNTALRVGASYSWNKLDTQRQVGFTGLADSLKSGYDASTTQIFGEIGQKMDMGSVALEPFAGLAYVNVDTKDFRESGGAAALHSGGASVDSTFSTLGVRASTSVSESTKLRGTLGWRHAFGDKTPTSSHAFATGQSFTVAGVPLAKDVAVVEAGVETQLQSNMTLSANYAAQFGNGLKDHGFKVTLGWKF